MEIHHTVDVDNEMIYGKKEGYDEEGTVLMFPSDHAQEITKMDADDLRKIKRVILIDSTWSQTRYYLR